MQWGNVYDRFASSLFLIKIYFLYKGDTAPLARALAPTSATPVPSASEAEPRALERATTRRSPTVRCCYILLGRVYLYF